MGIEVSRWAIPSTDYINYGRECHYGRELLDLLYLVDVDLYVDDVF